MIFVENKIRRKYRVLVSFHNDLNFLFFKITKNFYLKDAQYLFAFSINEFQEYRLIKKKGGGTFSEVIMAQSIQNGKYVAIKCMKNHFDSIEQVYQIPYQSLHFPGE